MQVFPESDRIRLRLGQTKRNEFQKEWEDCFQDLRCVEGDYPIHFAVSHGLIDLAAVILDAKVSVDMRGDPKRLTPLHCAAVHGHAAAAKLLLSQGADKEAVEKVGLTPMHWAAVQGHVAATQLLLGADALKESKDYTWEIPLHLAAMMGYPEVCKVLLKGENQARLRLASSDSRKVIVREDMEDDEKGNPTWKYVFQEDFQDGVTGELFDVIGSQDLIFCLTGLPGVEKREFMKEIVGEKTYLKNANGKYVTYDEAQLRLKDTKTPGLEIDFVCGTAPNARNISGWTPLHSAAYSGRADVVKVLLNSGAHREVKSQSGQTPLDYARLGKHKAVREMLGDNMREPKRKNRKNTQNLQSGAVASP